MDDIELRDTIRSLVGSLARTAPEQDWPSVTHLFDHGEEEEAMDVLVATLVRGNVPVTSAQQETVRRLMGEFEFTEEGRRTWSYLSDPEMLDRMTVVDGPS